MAEKTKSELLSENLALRAQMEQLQAEIKRRAAGGETAAPATQARITSPMGLSDSRYRRLFETAPDGILILDGHTGKIEDANPFMEQMSGYRQAELVGKSLWEIGLFEDISASQAMFRELKNSGHARYEELSLQTKNGGLRAVEVVSNMYSLDRRMVVQCNVRDIGRRKEAEARTKAINDELVSSLGQLESRDRELQVLYHMNDLLQSCNVQEEAYQVIRIVANELFNGESGGLAILHPRDQYLEVVVNWGDPAFLQASFPVEACWALRRGQLHPVRDPQESLVCRHFSDPVLRTLCIPLMVQGETLGVLSVSTPSVESRQQRHQQLAVIVGEAIKLSLSNLKLRERLREQALTDPLTGLGNRHYLEDNLTRELARTVRRETPLSIAMLDLDHFKDFNDAYGHDAGDMLLRRVGALLRNSLREADIKCRYGGEEFVLVLIDSPLDEVRQRLDQLRQTVKEIEIRRGKERLRGVSVSIGIVETRGVDWTASRLLRAADEAMYAAKNQGRDRVVVYGE